MTVTHQLGGGLFPKPHCLGSSIRLSPHVRLERESVRSGCSPSGARGAFSEAQTLPGKWRLGVLRGREDIFHACLCGGGLLHTWPSCTSVLQAL